MSYVLPFVVHTRTSVLFRYVHFVFILSMFSFSFQSLEVLRIDHEAKQMTKYEFNTRRLTSANMICAVTLRTHAIGR